MSFVLPKVYQNALEPFGSKAFSLSRSRIVYQTSHHSNLLILFPAFISLSPEMCIVSSPVRASPRPLWLKIQKEEIQMRNLKGSQPGSGGDHAHRHDGCLRLRSSYNNLTDKGRDCKHDAVSMLVSLGIIEANPTALWSYRKC